MMALDQRALGKYAEPIVYVVDDDISVRESLELLIRQAGWVPLMFDSAHAFLSHPRADAPHCLVLDLTLPDINGLDVQNEVYRDQRFMPIIFITGQGDIPTSVQAMKAGAFEFLTKPFFHDELLLSIKHAIERSRAVLRDEAELNVIRDRYRSLTPREREILDFVSAGYLNKQIGAKLGISIITVKAHRGSLMRKMAVESIAEIVNIYARLRIPSVRDEEHSPSRL